MLIVLSVILFGLVFEYVNGFHDTANAIATVVSTRVLSPRQAIMLATVCNLIGALWGTAVATTIGNGLVNTAAVDLQTRSGGAVGRDRLEPAHWWLGLPSSSSHALIGGLCGATLALRPRRLVGDPLVGNHSRWPHRGVVAQGDRAHDRLAHLRAESVGFRRDGPAACSPCGTGVPVALLRCSAGCNCSSASLMGFSHGTNDAQKTMGIIALTLFTATNRHVFEDLPDWLAFLQTPQVRGGDLGQNRRAH